MCNNHLLSRNNRSVRQVLSRALLLTSILIVLPVQASVILKESQSQGGKRPLTSQKPSQKQKTVPASLPVQQALSGQASEERVAIMPQSNMGRKDPTRPSQSQLQFVESGQVFSQALQLSAIFSRNGEHYAVINGQVLKTGEVIANKKVVLITAVNLILEDTEMANEATVLELFSSTNVKTQVVK